MHEHLNVALSHVVEAAEELFEADRRIQSVGVGQRHGELVYLADRNLDVACVLQSRLGPLPPRLYGLSVCLRDCSDTAHPLDRPGPLHIRGQLLGRPEVHLEQGTVRPLACGLEIQNIDADLRNGMARHGGGYAGTLGCMVHLADGRPALLSNNHVLADEGLGHLGGDRIQQGASRRFQGERHVAHLSGFVPLLPSPVGQPLSRPVHYNRVDAAVAALLPHVPWQPGFARPGLPVRAGAGRAQLGDRVFKVGRTTGVTWGTIQKLGAVTRLEYATGMCWFNRLIAVTPDPGQLAGFAAPGDSGAILVRDDGAVLGLVFAGGVGRTYACDIEHVLSDLHCSLATMP